MASTSSAAIEFIDVDEFYKKFEDKEGEVMSSDASTYRQGKRAQRGVQGQGQAQRPQSRQPKTNGSPTPTARSVQARTQAQMQNMQVQVLVQQQARSGTQAAIARTQRQRDHPGQQHNGRAGGTPGSASTPASHAVSSSQAGQAPHTMQTRVISYNRADFPSSIGPAIQQMRSLTTHPVSQMQNSKRSSASNTPQESFSVKRRKIEPSRSPSIPAAFSRPTSPTYVSIRTASTNAIAGPSKPKKATAPPRQRSPDLSFVDYVPKANVARSSKKRSGSPLPFTSSPRPAPFVNGHRSGFGKGVNGGSANVARRQHQKRAIEVIELDSDDEEEEVKVVLSARKKQKLASPPAAPVIRAPSPIDISDSDAESSDDDWNPPGFDLNDPDRWLPMEVNNNRLEDDVVDDLEHLTIAPKLRTPSPSPRYIHPNTSRWRPPPPPRLSGSPVFIWDQLRLVENLRFRPRPRPVVVEWPRKVITRPLELDFNLHRLKPAHSFKDAPGSIGKIEQKDGWTVIGSASLGGTADIEADLPNPHNRPGTIMIWRDALDIPDGHHTEKAGGRKKFYSVHDVKFDPSSSSFVSSGEDRRVRLWTRRDEADMENEPEGNNPGSAVNSSKPSRWRSSVIAKSRQFVPHALAFKAGSSVLAIAEKKVQLYSLNDDTIEHTCTFQLNEKPRNIVGSMEWGAQSTSDHLFVSSEPTPPPVNGPHARSFDGVHKVYDLPTLTTLYQLDATEGGDVLALNPEGSTLALTTEAVTNKHILRLYDVQRQDSRAIATLDLAPFPDRDPADDYEGEVNVATYSPDGMFLALARNDNHTHVYDVRMLSRGPVFDYEHFGECRTSLRKERYGVVKAQWVQSSLTRRMALVTGGEDGCIRLWDPMKSDGNPDNGTVLAEMNSDIGSFSLGDPFAGDHQLVVGDSSGQVTIFDNIVI